ncbi:MAG TPA: tRNA (N(6)-L-threonylcarbamoyladenosine(37)-C(2))-methylthiotransferase MtaB [Terriglobales bacterium]|nr:tRNA (N(6)-L-threonylcarbamoyladenosine(37)-C(2))-methylthiotransferase MtaB [Terriglobales bacterium]
MSSFHVENFGCRATQADGAAIERQLMERGFSRAADSAQAALVVLNTCTVTASADQDVRTAIRRVHRQNPQCRILVTGCYAQRAPREIAAIPGVDWVVGNSHKHQIAELACPSAVPAHSFVSVASLASQSHPHRPAALETGPVPSDRQAQIIVGDIFAHTELLAAPVLDADTDFERTRPNLKVQDGCNNRCSFCIIPSVRGRSRSLSAAEVVRQVQALVSSGYREVVLSGINLGRWGRDYSPPSKFAHLLRAILEQTAVEKLRISSVEPMDWTDELIDLISGCSRVARHAHVPLQSGSDRVLRLMHRKYRPWHYAEKIRAIRAAMPSAAIGGDVMVGFPGETDSDFEQTRALIAELPFTYLHVFTFSARPGTPAAVLPDQAPAPIARERNRILRELAAEKKSAFQRSFLGSRLPAITLKAGSNESTDALTDNYLKLRLAGRHESNRWLEAHIHDVSGDCLVGQVGAPGNSIAS